MRTQILSVSLTLLLAAVWAACGSDPPVAKSHNETRPEPTKVPPPKIHAPPEPLQIERYGAALDAPQDAIDVSADTGGGLWVISTSGVFVRPAGSTFFIAAADAGAPRAIGGLAGGSAAASSAEGSARLFRLRGGELTSSPLPAISPQSARIRPAEVGEEPVVLVTSGAGLEILDLSGKTIASRALPAPVEASDVALAADGSIWVGSRIGLYRLSLDEEGALTPSFSPLIELVAEEDDDIVALDACPDGTIWASSLGRGVFRLSSDGALLEHLTRETSLPQDHVLSIACDPDGSVWFGTSWGGLARRMDDGSMRYHSKAAGLLGDSVRRLFLAIDEAGERTLWIATEGGLASYRGP